MINLFRMRQLLRQTVKVQWRIEQEEARATKINLAAYAGILSTPVVPSSVQRIASNARHSVEGRRIRA